MYLPEGAYPDVLEAGGLLYSDDRTEECMKRCLDAADCAGTKAPFRGATLSKKGQETSSHESKEEYAAVGFRAGRRGEQNRVRHASLLRAARQPGYVGPRPLRLLLGRVREFDALV